MAEAVNEAGSSENKFCAKAGQDWREWKRDQKRKLKGHKSSKREKKLRIRSPDSTAAGLSSEKAHSSSNERTSYTVSIAVPGSILDNAQSLELKTYLAGQIARSAAVFNVNEIVVFDDTGIASAVLENNDQALKLHMKFNGCNQLIHVLQYLECPQYLRKHFFTLHKSLQYAGLLNPLDIPHHLRKDEECEYREGRVINKPVKAGNGSFVDIGLHKMARIDKALEANIRVTVKLDKVQNSKKHYTGKAVSPLMPYKCNKIYWGYTVRMAKNLKEVLTDSPYKEGYDVTIGTSDKGDTVDRCKLPPFKHLLIVFGGLGGLEACLDCDELWDEDDPASLFNYYLNTCPSQGSRTIRTEEAILITLSCLRPKILQAQK